MSRRLISAALALVDGQWVTDAEILIDGDQILAAGPAGSLRAAGSISVGAAEDGLAREDWGDVAVLPGCVNGHGHTFQALVRGFGDDLPFGRWMSELVHPAAAGLDRHAIGVGARFDFAEMLRMGITTAVEFFYVHDGANDNAMSVIEAARSLGIRVVLARCMFDANRVRRAIRRHPPSSSATSASWRSSLAAIGAPTCSRRPTRCSAPAPRCSSSAAP